jgi:hypothetical protein
LPILHARKFSKILFTTLTSSYTSRLEEKLRLLKSLQASSVLISCVGVKKRVKNIITKRASFQLLLQQFVLFRFFLFLYEKLRKKVKKCNDEQKISSPSRTFTHLIIFYGSIFFSISTILHHPFVQISIHFHFAI